MHRFKANSRINEINAKLLLDAKNLVREFLLLKRDVTASKVSELEARLISMLSVSASEMKKAVSEESDALLFFSISRAYFDAQKSIPDSLSFSVRSEQLSSKLFSIMALEISHLIATYKAYYSQRVRDLSNKTDSKGAKSIALSDALESLESIFKKDASGRNIKAVIAFEMTSLKFLSEIEHRAYINAASNLGFIRFEIHQKGHKRHGYQFSLDSYPDGELHPRSMTTVKIKEAGNVHPT